MLPLVTVDVVGNEVIALAHKAAGLCPNKRSSQFFFGRFQSMRGTESAVNSPRVSSLRLWEERASRVRVGKLERIAITAGACRVPSIPAWTCLSADTAERFSWI